MKTLIFSLIVLTATIEWNTIYAQQTHLQANIDTSYTKYSALKKHLKKYPFISIAKYKPINKIKEYRNIVYHKYDERMMHLDLFMPEKNSEEYRPGVALIHGGGWASGDKSLLEPFALALADNGYVTFCIEYRLSNEALYPAAVYDIKNAIKWIYMNASVYKIDTSKISIMGSSAGGQLAALIGVNSAKNNFIDTSFYPKINPKINAIIDIDGVIAFIHPLSKEGGKPGKKGAAEKWFGVHYNVDPTKWKEASALSYVDKDTPPTLFIASSFPRFNAGREDMITLLDKYGIFHETHVFDDAPHSFWLFNPWFEPTLNYIIKFLSKIKQEN